MNYSSNTADFLRFHGSNNTRDLGGYETADGRRIIFGRLYRSGELSRMNARSCRLLREKYGIRTIVDLRTASEKERHPLPELDGIELVEIPILQTSMLGVTQDNNSMKDKIYALMDAGLTEQDFMRMTYIQIVSDQGAMDGYRRLFDVLLRQENGATLFFCSQGRDRTGIAAMLILSALGVPLHTVMEDYLITPEKARRQKNLINVLELIHYTDQAHADFARALAAPSFPRLEAAWIWIKESYGSIDSYIREGVKLSDSDCQRLRDMYLDT